MKGLNVVMVPAWWPSPENVTAGIFFADYAKAFAAGGAKIGVVYPDFVGLRALRGAASVSWLPRITQEDLDGVPVIRIRGIHTSLHMPAIHMRRFTSWLRRGIDVYSARFGRPDVLHAMCAVPSGWAAVRIRKRLGTPVVVTEHSGGFDRLMRGRHGPYIGDALRAADAVVAVSEHLKATMRAAGIDREILVCGNPVAEAFLTAPVPARRDRGPVLKALFVGRLAPGKGLDEIASVATGPASDPSRTGVEWHLVGDGPLASPLRGRMAAAGVESQWHMHGALSRSAVVERMSACDFLVHPSHGETFGLAVAEALCVGLPVITTRGTACADFIVEGVNGCLVDRGDVAGLRGAVRRMVEQINRFDRAAIAAEARRRFSGGSVAEGYAALFRRVLDPVG